MAKYKHAGRELIKANQPVEEFIFDLSKISGNQLLADFQAMVSRPRPSSALFKWWGNKKLKLDSEAQRWVLDHLQNLRQINQAFINFKAEAILAPEMIADLVNGYRAEAERKWELAIAQHQASLHTIKTGMDTQSLSNQKLIEEIDRMKAENEHLRAQTDREKAKTELMRMVLEKIDLTALPDYLKAFVIGSVFNPSQPITNEMQLMDALKDIVIRQKEAQTRQAEAVARQTESDAKMRELTTKDSEYAFKESWDRPKDK